MNTLIYGIALSKFVNSAGLCLDIAGAVLIFNFGLPAAIDREGRIHIIAEQIDVAEKKRAERFDRYSRLGLALLAVGFVGQLASNFL
jgi:hypothetical protein